MIKKLLFIMLLSLGSLSAYAQFDNIGLLGGSTVVGWESPDMSMATSDGVVYTLNNVVLTNPPQGGPSPGVKFRKDNAWTTNWGGSSFPSGTAVLNGSDILVANGTYNVTFNKNTLQYSFVNVLAFDQVAILGQFNEWTDVPMATVDGVIYTLPNYTFTTGEAKFRIAGSWNTNWGSTGFPTGTGVQAGPNIPIAAGTYNVTFNRVTGAYRFDYVTLSIIGSGAAGWDTDVPMATTNGNIYTLTNYTLTTGELKFRVNNSYGAGNWGGSAFPSGTGIFDGPNLQVTGGTYDITFNRTNAGYSFTPAVAGTKDFSAHNKVVVYPNPAQDKWNFSATVKPEALAIMDITGKVIYESAFTASEISVDVSGFSAGTYFAKITSGSAVQVIRLIRK